MMTRTAQREILPDHAQLTARGLNSFRLGDEWATAYGIILLEPPAFVSPERDVEILDVPGRNGSLIVDKGRYKNVTLSFHCGLLPEIDGYADIDLSSAAERVAAFLHSGAAYRRLETSYDPSAYRMARLPSGLSVENLFGQAGLFQLQLDCKPQRYLLSGEQAVTVQNDETLNNWWQPSEPRITMRGNGDGMLYVGTQAVKLLDIQDNVTIDTELQNAYRTRPDGTIENANHCISCQQFPVLPTGSFGIHWEGDGIYEVSIIPRWWSL